MRALPESCCSEFRRELGLLVVFCEFASDFPELISSMYAPRFLFTIFAFHADQHRDTKDI